MFNKTELSTIVENPCFGSMPPIALDKDHMSVLIAVDTSGSVQGEPLRSINDCLNRFKASVCEDAIAARCVDVCVISFDDTVRVIQDWCPIRDMQPMQLECGGMTDLNGAVLTGIEKIRERSRVYALQGIRERKPYLVLLTDGGDTVTGNVYEAADRVGERVSKGKMKLFFLGFGCYDKRVAAQLAIKGRWFFGVENGDTNYWDFFDFAANSLKVESSKDPGQPTHVETAVGTPESNVKAFSADAFFDQDPMVDWN